MSTTRFITGGILAVAIAGGMASAAAARGVQQVIPQSVRDLEAAQLVEVRDRSGQVLLHGTLQTKSNSAKETEREADLASPSGQRGKGEVDVEIERKNGVVTKEEIEIEVEGLPAMTNCDVYLDGVSIASFVTSKKGKAEVELERGK